MKMVAGMDEKRRQSLLNLAKRLDVEFRDIGLLHQALTHTSYANESRDHRVTHNERLEFLGDAVLELASSTYLYKHFSNLPEGELTKARASVVCEAALCKLAAELRLGDYLLLGHGEKTTGGAKRPSILADAFEAVIGAIYLDQGWEQAQTYVLAQLDKDFQQIERGENLQDYKTVFQEVVQKHPGSVISYKMLSESGPDHNKIFEFAVLVNDQIVGTGVGHSKKSAEQHAAQEALKKYGKKKGL